MINFREIPAYAFLPILHISILRKYLHNLNKFMRSSSHFQFAKEKPPPPARSLAEFMQRSLAKAGSDCYWPRERSAIDGESMQNRESEAGSSTIHVWAVEIEFKFKFSDRGGSFSFFRQTRNTGVMESSRVVVVVV